MLYLGIDILIYRYIYVQEWNKRKGLPSRPLDRSLSSSSVRSTVSGPICVAGPDGDRLSAPTCRPYSHDRLSILRIYYCICHSLSTQSRIS